MGEIYKTSFEACWLEFRGHMSNIQAARQMFGDLQCDDEIQPQWQVDISQVKQE